MDIGSSVSLNEMQLRLIELLVKNKIVFLVIGGHAVRAYLPHRTTVDLDILLSRSSGNAKRLANAFIHHPPPQGRNWKDIFARPKTRLIYPAEQNHVADLLTSIDGINFGRCYANSLLVNFEDVKFHIPSLVDLIEMKKKSLESGNDASAHQTDRIDIEQLQGLL